MKTAVMLIALVLAAGIAAVAVRNARDGKGNDPASKGVSDPPVDVIALKAKADKGDAEAAYSLAKTLVKGEQGLPDYSDAARLFQIAADQGHVDAMVGLAEL